MYKQNLSVLSVASCRSIFLYLMSCLIACSSRPGSDFGLRSEFRLVFDPRSDLARPSPARSGPVRPAGPWRPLPYPCAPPPPNPVVSFDFLPHSNFPLPPLSLSPHGALGFGDEIAGVWIPRGEFSPPLPFLSLPPAPPLFFPWPRALPRARHTPSPAPSRAVAATQPCRIPCLAEPLPASLSLGEPRLCRAPPRVVPRGEPLPASRPSGRAPPCVAPPREPHLGRAPPRVVPPSTNPSPAAPLPSTTPPAAPWPRPGPRPGGRAPTVPSAVCPSRALGCALARPCLSPCPGSLVPRAACTIRVPSARVACSRACDRSRVSLTLV
jgi:hypothetical protein